MSKVRKLISFITIIFLIPFKSMANNINFSDVIEDIGRYQYPNGYVLSAWRTNENIVKFCLKDDLGINVLCNKNRPSIFSKFAFSWTQHYFYFMSGDIGSFYWELPVDNIVYNKEMKYLIKNEVKSSVMHEMPEGLMRFIDVGSDPR